MDEYTIRIAWSDEEQCYVAISPDLRDLSAVGSSAQEAYERFLCVVRVAVQLKRESGQAPSRPRRVHERGVEFRV